MSATRRGAAADGLAYTIDGHGRVLAVRDVRDRAATPATSDDAPAAATPATVGGLVAPLAWAWEPVQRLLAWGAREGLTAAELLDSCRAATRLPTTTRRRRSAR